MSSEWRKVKLGSVCNKIGSGITPRGGSDVYIDKGVSLIRSQNIYDFHFSHNGLVHINNQTASKMINVEVRPDDILLNITGDSVARCCQVPKNILPARVNQHVAIVRGQIEYTNPSFIKYLLCCPRNKDYLLSLSSSGATRNALTKAMIENLVVSLPGKNEQKAIAATLSCLDDKIELNNRMNKTLEEMAQAIFKSWFVDFEPYQDGEFVDSEMGRIPKGWRAVRFSDLVVVRYGKDHKKLANGNIPVYGSGGIMRYADRSLYDSETVLIPRKGSLNNILYVCEPFWSVDTMFFTEMKNPNLAKYIFHYVKGKDLVSMNCGSAVPSMTTDILNKMLIIHPDVDILEKFEDLVSPIYSRMNSIKIENATLSSLRDTLLPKLMSGEIRVPVQEE